MENFEPKKLSEIADVISGEINNQAYKDLTISKIASSPKISTSEDLVFIYEQKYLKELASIKARAYILPFEAKDKLSALSFPVIWVKRPRLVLKHLLHFFARPRYFPSTGVHESASIDKKAKIAKNVSIGANVFIGPDTVIEENTVISPNVYVGSNVQIGKNCIIYPNVTILDFCKIGNNVILHPGVVIGSDGYSYVTEEESNLERAKKGNFNFNFGRQVQHKIPSIGGVIVEDEVEIGANSCIDAGTIGPTVIGEGTKIDNLVQVAHNCKIGKDCLIVGQVGFAGSVTCGDRVVVGGQSGFADNINIGSDVIFVARSAVHGDIPSNNVYMGMPAVPYKEFMRQEMHKKRMPRKVEKVEGQVKELEAKLKELENKLDMSLQGSGTTEAISFCE